MSELSEAIERAQKRLDKMTEAERFKYHVTILREELERGASGMEARKGGDVPATFGSLKNTTAGGAAPSRSDDSPTGKAGDAQGEPS